MRKRYLYNTASPYEFTRELYLDERFQLLTESRDNWYFITNWGRVAAVNKAGDRNNKHNRQRRGNPTWRWLTPTLTSNSCPYQHQVRTPLRTYILSAEVGRRFLPGYEPGLYVCHYDEDAALPYLHSYHNLWIGTPGENLEDAYRKGRKHMSNQYVS